jgi:hypothetical protein
MRFLPTKVHGVLDYMVGLLLVAMPWVAGFAASGPETWVFVSLGVGAFVYSVFTNYELGLIRVLPMRVHLTLDAVSGLLLASSPWLFGFSEQVYLPHLVMGLFEIGAAAVTRTLPSNATAAEAHPELRHQGRA